MICARPAGAPESLDKFTHDPHATMTLVAQPVSLLVCNVHVPTVQLAALNKTRPHARTAQKTCAGGKRLLMPGLAAPPLLSTISESASHSHASVPIIWLC